MYPNPNNGNQQPPLGFGAPGAAPPNCPYPPQNYPPQNFGVPAYPPPYPTQGGYPGYPPAGPGYPTQQAPQYAQPQYAPAPAYQPQPNPYSQTQGLPGYQGYPGAQPTSAYPLQQPVYQQAAYSTAAAPVQAAPAMSQQYQDVPTIRGGSCDPSADAQVLRKAMKGIGTDEKAIINVLGNRTDYQRQQIAQAFKASFGKDLIKDLKSELSGRLEDVVLALMTPRIDYLAQMLKKSVAGIGTKESIIVDILCTASNQEIHMINASYQRQFGVPLEKDLKGDTSGCFQRLLVSICTGQRDESPNANPQTAADDAQKLLNAGEKKWGTDESMFNMILATRSYAQLRLMFHEYERLTGHSFEKAVEREFSGDVERGMLAIVKSAKNRAVYFAQRLHDSIAGAGTKDNDLIFIVVTRSEIDLGSISTEYNTLYRQSLSNAIAGDTSGDYKKILLAILGM